MLEFTKFMEFMNVGVFIDGPFMNANSSLTKVLPFPSANERVIVRKLALVNELTTVKENHSINQ